MDIRSYKKTSDQVLQKYITSKIREAQKIASRDRPHQLIGYIEDTIFAGGKRIRPYLIYLGYKLFGGKKDAEVIRFAGSAELIHSFALIHDDIIDKGDMRHNKMSYHKYASSIIPSPHADHLGNAQALLAGDLVFAWAYDILYSEYNLPQKHLHNAQKHMQAMIEEVVAGQMLDVDAMTGGDVDSKKLEQKNHYKSGQYTFTRPLVTGALLAGVDAQVCKKLEKIGTILGKAYQMRDDILDVTIAEGDKTAHYDNKTKFSDIQDGQQTYLTHYIYEHGTYAQRLAIKRAMGQRLSSKQIDELRTVFIDSGAVAYSTSLLHDYLNEATKLIKKLSVKDSSYTSYLYDIITLLGTL